jgi:Ca-activated chloride channel family protein
VYTLNVSGEHNFTIQEPGILVSDATMTITGLAYTYGGGGGGGCFPAGTEVWTRWGLIPIEKISSGSEVYAGNPQTGQWLFRRVLQTEKHQYRGDMVTITAGDAEIKATGNHPFWVVKGKKIKLRPFAADLTVAERPSTPVGRWIEARSLQAGDVLRGIYGRHYKVDRVASSYQHSTVYNLKVAELHTYAVGKEGILVHNKAEKEAAGPPSEPEIAVQPLQEQTLIVPTQEWNTEEYARIREQPFLKAMNNPLSTISIDVDTASYSNVRRFLQQGQLPPQDAVRIEEFINYFDYDYPEPEDPRPFAFDFELSGCPWAEEHLLLHLGLQGRKIAYEDLPPNNLVFLLDVSGSMGTPNKLPLLKESLLLLTEQMRSIDSVAIAVYAGAAGLVLPPTPGNEKQKIVAALKRLNSGGSTAGGAGIKLAYDVAKEHFDPEGNNRVILATDGDFNVGVSSTGALVRLIEKRRKDGIYLTVLGFGSGNYKDERMESLADSGNGNYAYIDTLREAKKALVTEIAGTLYSIANDVKIQIEFNPAVVDSYRLIGYENRLLRTEDFADDRKDAGEMGAGHSVTVLYELVLHGAAAVAATKLRYQTSEVREDAQDTGELLLIKFRYKSPGESQSRFFEQPILFDPLPLSESSNNFRFSAAVAAFAMILRDSEHRGSATCDLSLQLAEGSLGLDREWYRKEFLGLVKTAQWLDQQ